MLGDKRTVASLRGTCGTGGQVDAELTGGLRDGLYMLALRVDSKDLVWADGCDEVCAASVCSGVDGLRDRKLRGGPKPSSSYKSPGIAR